MQQLSGTGVLTKAERHALITYCQSWVRYQSAIKFLAEHGETYPIRDEQGRLRCLQQFPQVAIARHLAQQLLRYQQELGLTPGSRSRITVDQPGEDPFAEWLREKDAGAQP